MNTVFSCLDFIILMMFVFLFQLYVMQYVLRPSWRPYELNERCEEVDFYFVNIFPDAYEMYFIFFVLGL